MSNSYLHQWRRLVHRTLLALVVIITLGLAATANAQVTDIVAINAGGPAVSNPDGGDASFAADEYFVGGGDGSSTTKAITLTQPGANAAPMAVYQTNRAGVATYTIPNLTASSSYIVLLHFAETYFSAAGKREFNVAINGATVITNLDIYATVGEYAALVEQFTATANSAGNIVIALTDGTVNQPVISGIEIRSASAAACSIVPSAPTGLAVTGTTSSSISISWLAVTPPANCSISSYIVYGGTTPNPTTVVGSGLTGTSFNNTGLAASTSYYYTVVANDDFGASPVSAQVSATTLPNSSSTEIVAINFGGQAVSNASGGDASFVADEFFTGGGTSTSTSPVVTTGVTNVAPMNVYLTQRNGAFSYTIPGLAPGAQYTVLLHFAETYFSATGKRVFNVAINGTTVLSNFDIYSLVGENAALVEQFTATANSSGQIVIAYSKGTNDQPSAAGVEIRGAASACTLLPTAVPTGLTALASSPSIIGVNWSAATAPPNCSITYDLYASTTSGFTPGPSNLIASSLTGLSYSNTGLLPSTTYYYVVEAVDSVGASVPSTQASDTTHSATSCIAIPSAAPTDFAAVTASSSAIALSWTPIDTPAYCTNVTYSIYGSSTSGFVPALTNQIASNLAGTGFYDTNINASTTRYYVIQAVDEDGGATVYSQQISAATLLSPSVLTATPVSANEVDLVFPESTLPAPVTYDIYRSTTPTFTPAKANSIGTTQSNAYQDVVASPSTTYYYQVVATSPSGNSAPVGPVSATTLALGPNGVFFDASGIPPTPAGDVLMFKILNRTNGRYPDDQITWSTTINGVATSNTIAAQPYIAIPAGASGRMSFYLGPEGLSSKYVDFIEYTIGATFFNGDTTRVDAFAVKLAFNLTCADGTNIAVGENAATFAEDRSATFQRFATSVPAPFPVLAQAEGSLLDPESWCLVQCGRRI